MHSNMCVCVCVCVCVLTLHNWILKMKLEAHKTELENKDFVTSEIDELNALSNTIHIEKNSPIDIKEHV